MLLESAWFKTDIAEENLALLGEREAGFAERRTLELRELARGAAEAVRSLITDGLSADEAIRTVLVGDGERVACGDDIYSANVSFVEHYLSALFASDKAVFAKIFVNSLSECGIVLSEADFLPEGTGEELVVYVKNKLADEAFDVFSEELDDPRVMYAKDFREAARAVSRGDAAYCLLPLEEGQGVRIPSVSSLLYSEDLKINSVTPVFGPDGGADMKYALISRYFSVPAIQEDSDRYFEFRLGEINTDTISSILSAASLFGASVYRINSAVITTDSGTEEGITLVLSGTGIDFTPLIVYLTVFMPAFVAVGIYDNIE